MPLKEKIIIYLPIQCKSESVSVHKKVFSVTTLQIINHFPEIQPLVLQQHQQVVHQIRRLILQLEAVVHRGGQRGLDAFFPHFLRNTLGAAGVQLRRIGALRVGVFTLGQQLLQLIEEQPLVAGFAEAAGGAFMAGRPDRVHQHQQRIVVTVRRDAHHIEDIARGFTLGPQPLFGA